MEKSYLNLRNSLLKFLYLILILISSNFAIGQVSVTATAGTPGPTAYTTLQLAFAAVNAGTHQGVITVAITGDTTETATASLNASGAGSAIYTAVNISPSGGGARTITGALAAGSPIIRLNGADNVVIDGLNSGGNSLTISNTTVGATSTITLLNDASNNTITRCAVLGSSNTAANGNILILSGTASGNDNNTISFCNIGPAGLNLPVNGIYVDGTSAAISNDNSTVSNNNIFDYFGVAVNSTGIFLNSDVSGWTISNNRFYQTATRVATGTTSHRAIAISAANNTSAFTVNNNIIGFANASGTGRTIYSSTLSTNFIGIDIASVAGFVNNLQGNTIQSISYRSGSTSNANQGFFAGFNIAAPVNLGTITPNVVGSGSVASSIIIETTTDNNNNPERFTGIFVVTNGANSSITGNTIAGISTNGGPLFGYSIYPILVSGSGNFTVTNNTVGSATVSNSIAAGNSGSTTNASVFSGIYSGATGSTTITGNTIQNTTVYGNAAASTLNGITKNSNAVANAVIISNNTTNNLTTEGTGTVDGIYANGTAGSLTVNGNTLTYFELNNNSATFTGIRTTGAIQGVVNINNNKFGTATQDFVTTTNVFLSSITGISSGTGSANQATATIQLFIDGNDFRRIKNNLPCNGAINFIVTGGFLVSSTINNNTFTNIDIDTTGSTVLISAGASTDAAGTQTVTNNSIVTGFIRRGLSGNTNCFQTANNSSVGSVLTHTGNNMSNITVFGTSTVNGWLNSDNILNQKNINNNTFANWTGVTGNMTAMSVGGFGNASTVSNNTINNFSNQANINGILITAGGNAVLLNIDSNTITNLNTSGIAASNNNVIGIQSLNNSANVNISHTTITNFSTAGITNSYAGGIFHSGGSGITNIFNNTVSGLSTVSAGAGSLVYAILTNGGTNTSNVYKNKVFNIFSTATTPTLYGIIHSAGVGINFNAYNNLVTDFRAPNGSNGTNEVIRALAGISGAANSTTNFSYNTVLLTGSGGANFSTTGLYHVNQGAATTGRLVSRNNIIINNCTPSGTGLVSAFRRNSTAFTNYSTTSNNNLFYAGIPGVNNVIYFDGTNRRQTLNNTKIFTAPGESSSETENVVFLSTAPASPDFLRPSIAADTYVESSGTVIAGISDDFLGTIRFGEPGYLGTSVDGTDVGAYEIEGDRPTGPVFVSNSVGGLLDGSYLNLSDAFNAINGGAPQTGANITVKINENINQGTTPAVLNAGAWTTLTINPRRNIRVFGDIAGDALITLNGAANVRINGINDLVNKLTIENISTSSIAGTSTIKFIGDASTNTVTNSIIKGAGTTTLATDGGVVFFSTGTTTGNDSNTISNSDIGPSGSNLPSKLIYSSGSIASGPIANSSNTITNCNLFDNFLTTGSAAIYATTGNTNWTITSNKIYQTATRTFTTNGTLYGIYYVSPTFGTGQNISSNIIGYSSNTQTGILTLNGSGFDGSFDGIFIQVAGNGNTINSNIISDIALTSAAGTFNAIATGATSTTIAMTSNSIRNVTLTTTTGTANGINIGNPGTTTLTTNNINTISRDTAGLLHGIFSNGTSGLTLNTNTINSLSSSAAAASTIYGIRRTAASGNGSFTTNVISALSGNAGSNIYGISFEPSTGSATLTANSISNLISTGGINPLVIGINKTNNANAIFSRNLIFNLASDAINPSVSGIVVNAASTVSITNNRIADLRTPNADAINPINGINITNATTATIVFNSVVLAATGGVTNFGSSALNVQSATNIISTNNILVNNSAALGTGLATALRLGGSINFATNYDARSVANNYFSTTGTIFTDGTNTDISLAAFQARATPDDASSINSDPTFISTDGTNIDFLKFDFLVANAVSNAGLPDAASTIDCDGVTRSTTTPDIGADEFSGEAVINSFSPTNLCETGNQTVTINGTNLNVGGAPIILFDGIAGTVLTHSPTIVTVSTPTPLTGTTFTLQTTFGPAIISTPYTVFAAPIAGTVSADQFICPNTQPNDITLTGNSGGTIIWQRATNATFTTGLTVIAGQTTSTLAGTAFPLLNTQKTYVRAVLSNAGCTTVFSPTHVITTATLWNGATWSDGVPTAGIGAIIAGNPFTVTSDLTACTLVVNNGVTVNVNAGVTVTLTNQINVNGSGRINFLNNSSLVQTNSATPNTGNIYYNRLTSTISNNFDFVYWSSPVTSQVLGRIWMNATAGETFYSFNPITPAYTNETLLSVMTPGRGYIARSWTNTNGLNSDNQTSPLFTVPGTWNANFKGIPNNGDITVAVGPTDNLIGNPYPSAVDLREFFLDNSARLTGIFEFWTHNTAISGNVYTASDYATYNASLQAGIVAGSGGATPDKFVDAGQSFFAGGMPGSGNITFKNSHRVAGNNNGFYRTNNSNNVTQSEEIPVLESSKFWLNFRDANGRFKQQMITYTEGATDGYDVRLDAKSANGNPDIDFYSIIPSNKFVIQSRKLPFEVVDIVNLGYKTNLAGTYKIETDHYDGLFDTQEFYLRDNTTGIVHDIKKNPYSFTTAAGTFDNRFQIIYEYTCAQNTMWDGQRWSNGLPSLTKGAVIFEDFTATTDMSFCTLDIIGSAKVTVPSGFDFNVQHVVNVAETTNLTFENNANLLQISKTSNKGNVTIKRNVDLRRLEYTYWSSPVEGQNLLSFSPQTLENRFYTYDETANDFTVVATPNLKNFQPATGYSVRAPNNFAETPTTFNGIFTGTPANGDFEYSGTKNNMGYNLIGNPYPSVLDADMFIAENPSTLYFWTKASLGAASGANYATYTILAGTAANAGGATPNGMIQVGQGFICEIPASKAITFNNRMRSGANSNQFFRVSNPTNGTIETNSNTTVEKHRFWLNLTSPNSSFNQIALGYMTGATNLVDTAIDGQLYSNSGTNLYSLIGDKSFAIQGRSLPFVSTDKIALGFKTDINSNFTIAIDHFDGLFEGNQAIYLKDNLTGMVHDLKQNPYSFNSQAGTFNARFEIVFNNSTLGNNDLLVKNEIVIASIKEKILVKSSLEKIKEIIIFDILGRKILSVAGKNQNEILITNITKQQQTLIVKVVLANGLVETKKVVL